MDDQIVECNGFLLFNDPHLWNLKPSTRQDKSYGDTVLGKIRQIVDIANAGRLVPLCTGDWVHRPLLRNEEGEALKTRLLRELNRLWTRAGISNVGNHDAANLQLSDGDTLSVIAESGPMRICKQGGPVSEFMVKGSQNWRIGIGVTPYGQIIPSEVKTAFPDADGIIWLTHHDIAFDGAYPGAVEPREIEGCSMVWNGHMHLEKQPILKGQTLWCNMGSISRTAIDAINHEPAAWEFSPDGGIVRHALQFERVIFDLTGSLIEEISPGEAGPDGDNSVFVDMLSQDIDAGAVATDEGTIVRQQIQAKFERDATPPAIRSVILSLLEDVTAEAA